MTTQILKSIFDKHVNAGTYNGMKLAGDALLEAFRTQPALGNNVMLTAGMCHIADNIPADTIEHKAVDFLATAGATSLVSSLMETYGQMPLFNGKSENKEHVDLVTKALAAHAGEAAPEIGKRFSEQAVRGIVASATVAPTKEAPSAQNAVPSFKPTAEEQAKMAEQKAKPKTYGPKDTYVCPKCGSANKFKNHRKIDIKFPESVPDDIAKFSGQYVCKNCAKVMEAADATAKRAMEQTTVKDEKSSVVIPEVLPPVRASDMVKSSEKPVEPAVPAANLPVVVNPDEARARDEAEILIALTKEEQALSQKEAVLKKFPSNKVIQDSVKELRASVQALRGIVEDMTTPSK